MNKSFLYLILMFLLPMSGSCSASASKTADTTAADSVAAQETPALETSENNNDNTKRLPKAHIALLESYPDQIKDIVDNEVIMADGSHIVYDDGKEKDYLQRLNESDIEDMFYDVYRLPEGDPEYLYDPGRSRSDKLYQAMYGKSAAEVERKLVKVDWFGQKVPFTSVNGAADSLRAVAKEIAQYPELKSYLKSSGTFYWRAVRGSKRMSAHSYGIAFDIAVDKSDYWQWKGGTTDELKKIPYANKIPRKLVEIFQKHGFIWGGSWYHYDTMHFEYRPELLRYAELMQ